MKHNPSFQSAECVASAVFWPVCLSVSGGVSWAGSWAVSSPVCLAVNGAVHQAIHRPLLHPNLRLFIAEIQQIRRGVL